MPPPPVPEEAEEQVGPDPVPEAEAAAAGSGSASSLVAAGIFLSRIAGLVRQRVLAQFFGTSLYADVFSMGTRMPNVLQNLLGEGTLSASFIPVYSELLERGETEEAGRVAGAVFSILFAVAATLAAVGVFFAPLLVSVFLPGFEGERRELTIMFTRIIFPMTAVLVLSAWALGILNSHRRFFIPYFAPVLWNAAIIAAFFLFGARSTNAGLLEAVAWGAFAGALLQLAIQLPTVLRLERNLRFSFGRGMERVGTVLRNAGPAVLGRGVVQLSSYLDQVLVSLLAIGGAAALQYAQTLYVLPVSLFGMSVAAAELPELSRQRGGGVEALRVRTSAGLQRVAFYVVPSFVAFVALGDVLVAGLFQTGDFDRADTLLVWLTLVGYSLGLIASTGTRLLSSTFFALHDTRTPAKVAALRVVAAAVLALLLMIQFEPLEVERLGISIPAGVFGGVEVMGKPLGPLGLTLGAGMAAWIEWYLLRRSLRSRLGKVGAGAGPVGRMFAAAGAGAAAGWGMRLLLPPLHPILTATLVIGTFGIVYFAMAAALHLREIAGVRTRLGSLLRRFR
jgi:putative peptidoglycan lipid II flippase